MSFLIVYKTLLAKFSYVYAGVILVTEGSTQQSSSVTNCCFIGICYLNLTIKKELQEEVNTLSADPTTWSNILKQFVGKLPTNSLSAFDHFVKLALKGLISLNVVP